MRSNDFSILNVLTIYLKYRDVNAKCIVLTVFSFFFPSRPLERVCWIICRNAIKMSAICHLFCRCNAMQTLCQALVE